MAKIICFDMDGTIADLYGVDNWLSRLKKEDPSPFANAAPMWDMTALNEVLMLLEKEGWEVRVISWLPKGSTEEYKHAVRKAKAEWLKRYDFPAQKFHFIQYGATKANSVRKSADYAILIDDNEKVRKGWSLGRTIDPTAEDIINILSALL